MKRRDKRRQEEEEDDSVPNPAVGPVESAHHGAWALGEDEEDEEDEDEREDREGETGVQPAARADCRRLWEEHERNVAQLRAHTAEAPPGSHTHRMVKVLHQHTIMLHELIGRVDALAERLR